LKRIRAERLVNRGLLKTGFCADITVFEPTDFKDRAIYSDPHQYPSGTRVFVNGVPVVENAAHTSASPGRVLRRNAAGAML
jgi:N-acyl-D-amino-acid deacylase